MKQENSIPKLPLEEMMKAMNITPMSEEQLRQVELRRPKSYLKEKYRRGLKTITRLEMKDLRKAHPDWPLNLVIATVFSDLSPELPPVVLLELFQFVVEEWEKHRQPEPALA